MRGHIKRIFDGEYDIESLAFSSPPTILDIGANVGGFTLWAARRWLGATIVCYEPNHANFLWLQKNVNHGTRLHEVAVWNSDGERFLYDGYYNSGECSLFQMTKPDGSLMASGAMVRTIPASELPVADIVKIDAEGAERIIVPNYPHWSTVRATMIEWHTAADRYKIGSLLCDFGLTLVSDQMWNNTPARGMMKWLRR